MGSATRLATLGILLSLGCFKLVGPPPDGAASTGTGPGSPPTTSSPPAPDADPSPQTCEELRYCVYRCGPDRNCVSRCGVFAEPAAISRYQTVTRCSLDVCPDQDVQCRCNAECGLGPCLDLVDGCAGRSPDRFCASACR
jgi:hypothetical protein